MRNLLFGSVLLASLLFGNSQAQVPPENIVEVPGRAVRLNPSTLDYHLQIEEDIRKQTTAQATGIGVGLTSRPVTRGNSGIATGCKDSRPGLPNGAALQGQHPVVIATGEKLLYERDFKASGDYGLGVVRHYRSLNPSGTLFGPYWLSSIDHPRLNIVTANCYPAHGGDCVPRTVIFTDSDGVKFEFALDISRDKGTHGFAYTARGAQASGELYYIANAEWTLYRNKEMRQYSNAGQLLSVSDTFGATTRFVHEGNRLRSVISATGKAIYVNYGANGLVGTLKDPAGSIWRYEYNGNRMLVRVTAPGSDPDIREYLYESPDPTLVTGIVINGVRQTRYTYHPDRRVHESGPEGGEEKETYNYGANLTNVQDMRGQSTDYTFVNVLGEMKIDTISRASTSTCAAASAKTVYDANGYIDYQLDWNGNRTEYTFDGAGRLQDITTAAGTVDALPTVYTWEGGDVKTIESRGTNGVPFQRVTYTYEGGLLKGELREDLKTGAAKRELRYDYAVHQNWVLAGWAVTRVLPEHEHSESHIFDESGNLTAYGSFDGYGETWSNHNGMGQPGRLVNRRGKVEEFGYHVNGNMTQHAYLMPGGRRFTRYHYNHNRQVTDVTYATGRVDRYRYKAGGRMDKTGDAAGNFAITTFDAAANAMTWRAERHIPDGSNVPVAKPAGHFSSTTVFDSLGRPHVVFGNNGQRTEFGYDNNGNLIRQADAKGHVTTFEYDAQNRPKRRVAPDGGVSRWEYDNEGRLRFFYDPRNVRTEYTYTGFGEVATVYSPDGGSVVYGFDAAGRRTSETRAGEAIIYTLDAVDRVLTRRRNGVTESYTYNGVGNLETFTDATGTTTYSYDNANKLIAKVSNVYGAVHANTWAYDVAGRLTGMGYDGNQLSLGFDYNAYGQLSRIRTSKAGTWGVLASQFLYQPATGRRYGWKFNNTIPRLDTLDTDGRVEKIYSMNAVNQSYGYDVNDTVTRITDSVYPTLSEAMGYDASDRLGYSGPTSNVQAYTWDQGGNRGVHRNFGVQYHNRISPTSNRLDWWGTLDGRQSRSFQYDELGNVWKDIRNNVTRTYEYDAFFRLNVVTSGTSLLGKYHNNAINQRVAKEAPISGVTHYTYGPGGELLAEYNGSSRTYYIWLGGELLAVERDGNIYASHNDRSGRPVVLLDAAAKKAWRAVNTAFDRHIPETRIGDMNLGYPGQYYDKETGLWYNWHRYYDASLGRYLQADYGSESDVTQAYAYAAANPLSFVDFDGFVPIYRGEGVVIQSYPGPQAGGIEHARWGPGQNYHVHVFDGAGRKARISTETWQPLTPADEEVFSKSKQMQRMCEKLTDGEKKFLDRVNRNVFHTGAPSVNQLLRLGGFNRRGSFRQSD